MVTNSTEMITGMNATTKLNLVPSLFKPHFSIMQTCNSAVPIRLPQHYFQSLLNSVSLNWNENKNISSVLCCAVFTSVTQLHTWDLIACASIKPSFSFLFLCPLLLPLLHFPRANWQQQGFKGDKQLCYLGVVRFQRINSSCSCCSLFEATLQPISSEKTAQRRKCGTGNGRFDRRIKISLFVHQLCHGSIWYNCTWHGITALS